MRALFTIASFYSLVFVSASITCDPIDSPDESAISSSVCGCDVAHYSGVDLVEILDIVN